MTGKSSVLIKTLSGLAGLFVLILIIAWLSGTFTNKISPHKVEASGEKIKEGMPLAKVEKLKNSIFEEAAGTILATRRTVVSSRILASVKSINVRSGDTVKMGDTLVVLDDRDIKSRIQQAEDGVAGAKAKMENLQTEYNRFSDLYKKGVTTKRESDTAETNLNVAKSELAKAEKMIEEAKVGLTYTKITSPVNGKVVDRFMEPGDTASPGIPIVQLYDPAALQLEASLREAVAVKVKIGETMRVHIDSINKDLEGTIDEIVPQAELGSRVFRVKIGLPPTENLFTGMYGRLRIPVGEREVFAVPEEALDIIGQNTFVNAVDDNDYIVRRLITTGKKIEGNKIEVLSGLIENERILINKK